MGQVVITGMGLCTSSGIDVPAHWDRLQGTSPNIPADCSFRTGQKDECDASLDLFQRKNGGFSQAQELAERAALEALKDAGFWDVEQLTGVDRNRFGCTVSVSKPLFTGSSAEVVNPEVINHLLRKRFGLLGESRNVIAACATGAYSAALGASWIEQDLCDVVLAGSVEPFPHPLIEAGFKRMGVVTREVQMRPFDRHRSGFVLSEGAGVVVLESEFHARSRGASWHARLSGWGWGTDGHSAVAFNSNGSRIADVVRMALRRAGLRPQKIGHVNAHGTATRVNDCIETQALIKVFGRHADQLMISATKSSTGHLLGAAGSVELILMVMALKHQYIPPTMHLEDPDPECPLDYTPRRGHAAQFDHALSLSFGFGGPIGALIVSAS